MRIVLFVAILAIGASPVAASERCVGKSRSGHAACVPPARTFVPYDPDRLGSGRRPGFIDMGGGTEIRVGGRARYEYGYSR